MVIGRLESKTGGELPLMDGSQPENYGMLSWLIRIELHQGLTMVLNVP
jgi:hypothetical protein